MVNRNVVFVLADDCKGCGLCIDACPLNVLEYSDSLNIMGYRPARYTGDGCSGCGACFYTCPEPGAITVIRNVDELEKAHCPHCDHETAVYPDYRDPQIKRCLECHRPVNTKK
jgi:NAD-dependent dihydropyrimidine dehydrogenase PreA subunit